MTKFPFIPVGDLPDTRENKTDPWHVGLMITQGRALTVARALFPDEETRGEDCRAEYGRFGEPCRICADRNEQWSNRVRQVRLAMLEAFK